jgi:hypothetical protein
MIRAHGLLTLEPRRGGLFIAPRLAEVIFLLFFGDSESLQIQMSGSGPSAPGVLTTLVPPPKSKKENDGECAWCYKQGTPAGFELVPYRRPKTDHFPCFRSPFPP